MPEPDSNDWPFSDPPNVAVFTSAHILSGDDWIHYVCHDEDDGGWQFHPSRGYTPEAEARVVSLRTMLRIEPAIAALADLPAGWHAWRDNKSGPWQRCASHAGEYKSTGDAPGVT